MSLVKEPEHSLFVLSKTQLSQCSWGKKFFLGTVAREGLLCGFFVFAFPFFFKSYCVVNKGLFTFLKKVCFAQSVYSPNNISGK